MNSVDQDILPQALGFPPFIKIRRFSVHQADNSVFHLLQECLSSLVPIGIAVHTSDTGNVEFISIANTITAHLISFDERSLATISKGDNFTRILSSGGKSCILDKWTCCLVGFSMARTAVQLSRITHSPVKGIDLNTLNSTNTRKQKSPADIVAESISKNVEKWKIHRLWFGIDDTAQNDVCLQAWLAACVASRCLIGIQNALRVDTTFINASERDCLASMIAQANILNRNKLNETPTDFSKISMNKFGKIDIINSRYKTRVRQSDQTQIIMTDANGREFIDHARSTKGKTTTVDMQGGQFGGTGHFQRVRVVGRQEPTNSEQAQDELIHLILTGQKDLRQSPYIRMIWFPQWKPIVREICPTDLSVAEHLIATMMLNTSQRDVIREMVGNTSMMIAHGPPGTGKTTTISAASRIWCHHNLAVWIVAHSNVAVKNIAESLSKQNVDFKLLVSKGFYQEWHEHLYTEIERCLVRSDELPEDVAGMERVFGSSRIVLCTLSMLSNPMLQNNGTFEIIPVQRLVIDEASQINIFEFMHIFVRFQGALGKVCFFGDPKQLPPFGGDRVQSIKTIFDVDFSNFKSIFFLDTQYRMPVKIGQFISKHVYNGRLKSEHPIKHDRCVAFIDVPHGGETKAGFSWKNDGEIQTLTHIVRSYYRHKNFCIVTPYDGQRAAIQRALDDENLPSDSVYNLDSFQGNEADYILISVVRSDKPGFLVSKNRMNVLLTRCKKGMVIVTNSSFVQNGGSPTLLGSLTNYWSHINGIHTDVWIHWKFVANGTADLPDAPGPNRDKKITFSAPNSNAYAQPLLLSHRRILVDRNQLSWSSVAMAPPSAILTQLPRIHCDAQGNLSRIPPTILHDDSFFPPLSSKIKQGSTSIGRSSLTVEPNQHSLLLRRTTTRRQDKVPEEDVAKAQQDVVPVKAKNNAFPSGWSSGMKISLSPMHYQLKARQYRRH